MTTPGQPDQWPQQNPQQNPPQYPPQPPAQGGYPQPGQYPGQQFPGQPGQGYPYPQQPGQPQYGQSGQPQYAYGQYPHGQYPYGQDPYQQVGYQQQPGGPRRKSKRGLVVALVAVLVLALGGGATWWVLSQQDSVASGAATPEEAARNLATALGNGDVIGVLNSLAPAEASILTDQVTASMKELKRLGMIKQDADPNSLSGVRVETRDLRFDGAAAEQVNDHVTITKLVDGTLTFSADLGKLPLTEEYLDLALAGAGMGGTGRLGGMSGEQTLDIGALVNRSGQPVRIATVNVDGEWYPSLFHSIADYALLASGTNWPSESIPAEGADSPTEAVRQTVQAALDGDLRRVIELLPPDEMGVLHDVGPALLDALGSDVPSSGVKITRLEAETSAVAGGTRATVTALGLEIPGRGALSLTRDGDCYRVGGPQGPQRICADDFGAMVAQQSDGSVPPAVLRGIGSGLLRQGLGIVTTEVDGKHYVSPLRTLGELGLTMYRGMTPEDLKAMLEAGY